MVRIGGSTEKGEHIKENHYYTPSGEFRVDAEGSSTLHNCLMYKLCYYRFGQLYTEGGKSKFSYSYRVFSTFFSSWIELFIMPNISFLNYR